LSWTLQTLAQAYTVGVVVSMYDTTTVLEALFITLTVLLGLTAYTFQTKRDFSFLGFGLVYFFIVILFLISQFHLSLYFFILQIIHWALVPFDWWLNTNICSQHCTGVRYQYRRCIIVLPVYSFRHASNNAVSFA